MIIFFYFYYDSGKDLKVALPPLIIATLVVTILVWLFEKKVAFLPLLGGFFIAEFGMLPKNGEKLKVQDLTIKVTDTDNRRIKSFEIRKA